MSEVLTQFVEDADGIAVVRTQDVEAILDRNKALQNFGHNGWTGSRAMRHVAEIPLVVAEDWLTKYGVNVLNPDHAQAVRRLLNDPDYRYLRTAGGGLRK